MGKKKPTGGKHTTQRNSIAMPRDWHAVATKLAAQGRQPVLWYLLATLAEKAEAAGIAHPKLPWEKKQEASGEPDPGVPADE